MIWVAWRQHRAQLIAGAVLCGLLVIVLLFTGLAMRATYDSLGIGAACLKAIPASNCESVKQQFNDQYSGFQFLLALFLLFPVLLGVFWGAPLIAREVEQGTHRLAWTQSITRRRWLLTKLAVIASAGVVLAGVYAVMLWWWADPLVSSDVLGKGRFSFGLFDLQGIVPVAYTLFAVALGVAAGVVLQRVTAAMMATFFGFAAIRLVIELWLRPHYQTALHGSYAFLFSKGGTQATQGPPIGSWTLSDDTVTATGFSVSGGGGHGFSSDRLQTVCPNLAIGQGPPDDTQMQQCVAQHGIHYIATYQPYDRYWLFQGIESALFIVLAVALIVFSLWWVRRRVR